MSTTQQTKQLKLAQHSAEDLQRAIAGKSELYEAAQRNGYYLPKMKASIITEQRITDVSPAHALKKRTSHMLEGDPVRLC
jgi:hypothetical protein